jgi:hypothetical protein
MTIRAEVPRRKSNRFARTAATGNTSSEVDFGDETGVPDQAIRGESDGSDKTNTEGL